MNVVPLRCESCGMPMETAEDHAPGNPDSPWCLYCSRSDGSRQAFEEVLERLTQWMRDEEGVTDPGAARAAALGMMSDMPAWQSHSGLQEQQS